MIRVHLSAAHAYILEQKSGAVTVISPPIRSLPYTPRELEVMRSETGSVSSYRTNVAGSVSIPETEEDNESVVQSDDVAPLRKFKVGEMVDVQRNSGKWTEGVVVRTRGVDTVYIQYFAQGAKFQKKLHVNSECIAYHKTKVRKVTFGREKIHG
jgi:hypothetical protein